MIHGKYTASTYKRGAEGSIPSGDGPLFPLQQGTYVLLCPSAVHSPVYPPNTPFILPPLHSHHFSLLQLPLPA